MGPSALILAGTLLLSPSGAQVPGREAVPDLLHDGRFQAAREAIGPVTEESPPEDAFLQAFVTYWTMIFEDDNPALERRLEKEVELALKAAERAAQAGNDPTAALWSGNAHLVLAELRAGQRKSFAAAFEAKKAKKLLEAAVVAGVRQDDALFGLGTYNYMADTLPSFIKGLRALLFIPKGNRAGGLEQLRKAAESSRTFGFEARVLLLTIYAHKHERRYDEALAERDRLLAAAPDRIAALYAAARLDLSLSRNRSAIAWVTKAQEQAATLSGVDPVVLRSLDLLRARAELADLRPRSRRGDREACDGRPAGPGCGDQARPREHPSRLAGVRPGDRVGARRRVGRRRADGPRRGRAGRSAARADRGRRAAARGAGQRGVGVARARGRGGLARGWMGGCLLRQGQAADLGGDRARAVALYKRASETTGFPGKDAAYYHQAVPYRAGT